jgi:hypothetical protein
MKTLQPEQLGDYPRHFSSPDAMVTKCALQTKHCQSGAVLAYNTQQCNSGLWIASQGYALSLSGLLTNKLSF